MPRHPITDNNRIITRALSSVMAASILLCPQTLAAQSATQAGAAISIYKNQKCEVRAALPRPKVRLIPNGRSGIRIVTDDYSNTDMNADGLLISIDGKQIKGLALDDIELLLMGNADTLVEITFIDRYHEVSKVRLPRLAQQVYGQFTPHDLRYRFRDLQNEGTVRWVSMLSSRFADINRTNLDLFARAERDNCLRMVNDLPEPKSRIIERANAQALINSDTIGDTAYADTLLSSLLIDEQFVPDSKLIEHLFIAGRHDNAEFFSKKFLENVDKKKLQDQPPYEREAKWSVLKILAKLKFSKYQTATGTIAKDSTGAKEINTVLNQMFPLRSNSPFSVFEEVSGDVWLGDAFEKIGNYEQAIACYQSLIASNRAEFTDEQKAQLSDFEIYSFPVFRLAQLKAKSGNRATGIALLTDLLSKFDCNLRQRDQELAERAPFYSPARSDIELELSRQYLDDGKKELATKFANVALSRIEQALGKDSPNLKPGLQLLQECLQQSGASDKAVDIKQRADRIARTKKLDIHTDTEKFVLVRDTVAKIRAGDIQGSRDSLAQLICIYSDLLPVYDFREPKINLFSCLFGIARDLADKARFDESHQLLDLLSTTASTKELNTASIGLINAEKALNQKLQDSSNELIWKKVDEEYCLVREPYSSSESPQKKGASNLRIQENMRRFAALYSLAGYPSRADFFIERALKFKRDIASDGDGDDHEKDDVIGSKIMVLLDAAAIRAKAGKADEAQKLALEAVSLCRADLIEDHKGLVEIQGALQYKTIQICEALSDLKHEKEALTILQALIPRVTSSISKLSADADIRDRHDHALINRQNSILRAFAAKLLFKNGQIAEADRQITAATEEYGIEAPIAYDIIGANIAESSKNYSKVARYYSEAAKRSVYADEISDHNPQFRETLLKRAVSAAEMAPSYDPLERASIYIRYAADLCTHTQTQDKRDALNLYLKALELIPDSEYKKVDLLGKISSLKQELGREAHETKTEEKSIQTKREEVSVALKSAELAEKNQNTDAPRLWFSLATQELKLGAIDSALVHAQHAIELYKHRRYQIITFDGIFSSREFITTLCKMHKEDAAEKLYLQANERVKTSSGEKSPQYAEQLAQYFTFLANQKRDSDALKILDEITAIGIREVEVGQSESARTTISWCCRVLSDEGRGDFALKILEKLLAEQRRVLDSDDWRISDTLAEIAKIQLAKGKTKEAEASLSQSFAIRELYSGRGIGFLSDDDYMFSRELASVYISVLKKLGKESEAAKVEQVKKNRYKLNPDIVDPWFFQENKRIAEVYKKWATSPVVADMENEYQEARKQAPYCRRSRSALEAMIRYADKYKDWNLLADVATKRIEIQKRMPDTNAGIQTGCTPPDFRRLDFYKYAITANIELGNLKKAQQLINRIYNEVPVLADHEKLDVAILEHQSGLHDLAVKHVIAVETSPPSDDNWNNASYLAQVWGKLGDKERARHFYALEDQERQERKKKDAQRYSSPLYDVNINRW